MEYLKFIYFVSVLHFGELIPSDKVKIPKKNSNLISASKMMEQISKSCYKNHSIVVYNNGNLADIHLDLFKNLHSAAKPTISLNNIILHTELFPNTGEFEEKKTTLKYPDEKLIIFTHTEDKFVKVSSTFNSISKTKLPFFVINLKDKNCHGLVHTLNVLWFKYERLYYYLCINAAGLLKVVTINPYSSKAPDSWTFVTFIELRTEYDDLEHFALFSRTFDEDTICHGLDFDRTDTLEFYNVKIAMVVQSPHHLLKNFIFQLVYPFTTSFDQFFYPMKDIMNQLGYSLDTTVEGFVFDVSNHVNVAMAKRYFRGLKLDMLFVGTSGQISPIFEITTHPSDVVEIGMVTHHKGFKMTIEKIRDYYGIWIIIYTVFILALTFFVIWWIDRRLSFAGFEILRLLIASDLQTPMTTVSRRMFFSFIFLYFLIIHATFNGNLVKFVSYPEDRKHPTTLDDLASPEYTKIFIRPSILQKMSDSQVENLKSKFNYINTVRHCIESMYEEPTFACVSEIFPTTYYLYGKLYLENKPYNVYHSRKPVSYNYVYNVIRRDTLLSDRLNLFVIYRWEFGIIQYATKDNAKMLDYLMKLDSALNQRNFMVITVKDLIFAFGFLGIGLTCATVTFIAELFIHSRTRIRQFFKKILLRKRPRIEPVIILDPSKLGQSAI